MKSTEDTYELSPMQRGMLFHSLYAPDSGVDIVQMVIDLHEDLAVPDFERAWQRVVERHPVLRTSFRWSGLQEPLQDVHQHVELHLCQEDQRGLPPAEQESRLQTFLRSDRDRGFDLTKPSLMRLMIFRRGESDYQCIWTFHLILLDGDCFPLVVKDVFQHYEAFRRGEDAEVARPRPFRDHIEWLQQHDLSLAEGFWRDLLKGFISPVSLAIARPPGRTVEREGGPAAHESRLSEETTSALKSLAEHHQLALSTVVQGAWALLLSRYSGQEDVVFGATRACRESSVDGAASMVGLLVNTLPVRVRVSPEKSLVTWLKGIRAQQLAVRDYEYSPLVEVQKWSDVAGGVPLFGTLLEFEDFVLDSALRAQGGSWLNRGFRLVEQAYYPVTVIVGSDRELYLKFEYDPRLFDHDSVARVSGHLRTVLEGMARDPAQRLSDVPLLTAVESRQMLVEWNATQEEYPEHTPLHALFEAQVRRTPEAVAAMFESEQITYRELDRRANQLAHRLRKLGVGPDILVGVCLERSIEMLVSLLGVLKAGGAYVPMDPEYPAERLAFVLADTEARVLLTQERLAQELRGFSAHLLCVDAEAEAFARESAESPAAAVSADNLAYVMYTSGSTGQPKGVMIPHRAICNHMWWMQRTVPLTEEDRVLQKTPFVFDASVWEYYAPLLAGARLILARPGGHKDSRYLVKVINEREVTVLQVVPSMLRGLLEEEGLDACKCLRRVFCGGEPLTADLQNRFFGHLSAELWNLYGPTEACIDATAWMCKQDSDEPVVPIGRPIANTRTYVLDSRMRPVPVGVTGELHIAGDGLARGYLRRPELTAERFVRDPFDDEPSARLYKTGDLARYMPDGNLEFVGRIDHQVKLRGFRIELGEIESVLGQHPEVHQAVVLVREDAPGDKRLVAYVAPKEEGQGASVPELNVSDLRRYLTGKLPEHMVPSALVVLDSLPLLPSGKVDRHALPAPDGSRPAVETSFVPPASPTEKALARIWSEVLGINQIGIHDRFLDLGGHSLLAIQVISRIREELQVELPLRSLFLAPTIAGLAVAVAQGQAEKAEHEDIEHILGELEVLSDEEAQQLLADERARGGSGDEGP